MISVFKVWLRLDKFVTLLELGVTIFDTFRMPSVKVPVLSVSKQVMLPLVSIPTNLRTKTFYLSIFFILEDKTKVIIIGKPSGTVTTMTVTLNVRAYKILFIL